VRWKENKLAPKIQDNLSNSKLDSLLRGVGYHIIDVDHEGVGKVYIVFQNVGRRTTIDYTVSITFEEGIDIVDVESEKLHIDGLYTSHPGWITNPELQDKLPQRSIQQFYSNVSLDRVYIKFSDCLDAFDWETVCISIRVVENVDGFRIYYRCDSPGVFPQREAHAQQVRVVRAIPPIDSQADKG
jgi:hypothetical protein